MGDVVDVPAVPSTMLVSAHGRKVSVPRRCIGRPVRLVCMPEGGVDCYMSGRLVASCVSSSASLILGLRCEFSSLRVKAIAHVY